MSGGRRKAKHPQKWEEFDYGEASLNKKTPEEKKSEENQNCSDAEFFYADGPDLSKKSVQNANISLSSKTIGKCSDDSEEEDLGNSIGSTADSGINTLDVLQGSRQGLLAECKACCIQLNDWSSAITHIQSHRLVFIPDCAKSGENIKVNKTVGPTCLLCQKSCQNLPELVFHVHSEHSVVTRNPLMCPFCGRLFSSAALLQQHMDIRDVCMKCPVCSASYDQEYELYSHISECLPTFHSHLRSLICHVCDEKINMVHLADHLITHSLAGEVGKFTGSTKTLNSALKEREQSLGSNFNYGSRMFLCEICDKRFSSLDKFQTHLNDHTEAKMYCPLCFLKGFEKIECLVRHLMIRCPRRSPEQIEFGNIISVIGKEHKLNFIDVLRKYERVQPFKEGLFVWKSIPLVDDALKSFESLPIVNDQPRSEPTDIELLLWFNQIENEPENHHTTSNYDQYLEEISKNCPGVTVIRGVNLNRLKSLQDEAKTLEKNDFLSASIDNGMFSSSTFLRLEWEAQYLRYKEPFYVRESEDNLRFNPVKMTPKITKKSTSCEVSPQILEKLKRELDELLTDVFEKNQNVSFDKTKLNKLLLEAKDG